MVRDHFLGEVSGDEALGGNVTEADLNIPKVPVQKGTYSIFYDQEESGYETRALDWNSAKGEWVASCHEGVKWYSHSVDSWKMRAELLSHFGLHDWDGEFPFERIVKMSPRMLAEERRAKERAKPLHLLPIVMRSYTLGYRVEAENHPD